MRSTEIENIIFDFGGVIMNIDFERTVSAFRELGIIHFDQLFSKLKQSDLFDRMDKGTVSPEDFRDQIREWTHLPLTDQQIDKAWNELLLDYPPNRIEVLRNINHNYELFLLSNTNSIHYQYYSDLFLEQFHFPFETLFTRAYWSFHTGMRKPDREIFERVLADNRLDPAKTLFIDDTLMHVHGAVHAGLTGYHLKPGEDIINLFENNLLKADLEFKFAFDN